MLQTGMVVVAGMVPLAFFATGGLPSRKPEHEDDDQAPTGDSTDDPAPA